MEEEDVVQENQAALGGRNRPFHVIPLTIGVVVVAGIVVWLLFEQAKSTRAESRRMAGVGAAYLEKGDKVSARACLSSAVILDPENTEAQNLLNSIGDEGMVGVPRRGVRGRGWIGDDGNAVAWAGDTRGADGDAREV